MGMECIRSGRVPFVYACVETLGKLLRGAGTGMKVGGGYWIRGLIAEFREC